MTKKAQLNATIQSLLTNVNTLQKRVDRTEDINSIEAAEIMRALSSADDILDECVAIVEEKI